MVSDLHKAALQGRKVQLGRQPQGVLGVAVPKREHVFREGGTGDEAVLLMR